VQQFISDDYAVSLYGMLRTLTLLFTQNYRIKTKNRAKPPVIIVSLLLHAARINRRHLEAAS